jgi:hypothetical protein
MTWHGTLEESAWDLLNQALAAYRDSRPATDRLHQRLSRFEEPLSVAVAGPWQSGKSTLINALVGEEIAPIEAADAAATGPLVFTWYQDGTEPRAFAYPADRELPVIRSVRGMQVDIGQWQPAPVNDIVVSWPARTLRHTTLVDTPALPTGEGDSVATTATEQVLRDADVVLYLTRDGRDADLQFLRRPQQGMVVRQAAVNLLLVLSRADELGGGRIDALLAARQLARRHHRDPRVGALCLGVVAVSGLVTLAGRMLSEPDFAALAALARIPRPELERCLLSTDRFVSAAIPAPVAAETRRGLLDRLGIFGVRLATTLIRTGSDSRAKLAAELVQRGGLAELRETLTRCFIDRRGVFKARSALVALESLLRTEPRPGVEKLFAELEHLLANAHDLREIRLLSWLRGRRVGFDGELAVEARRLIGENGTDLVARLGVDHRATSTELWQLSSEALVRWQERTEDPLLSLDQRRAAKVVARSCEGILARLQSA